MENAYLFLKAELRAKSALLAWSGPGGRAFRCSAMKCVSEGQHPTLGPHPTGVLFSVFLQKRFFDQKAFLDVSLDVGFHEKHMKNIGL